MVNNLLLSVILGVVFVGTLYPLVAEAMGEKLSVGPPYFNTRRRADRADPGRGHGGRAAAALAARRAARRWPGGSRCRSCSARRRCSRSCCSRRASACCRCSASSLALGVGVGQRRAAVEAQPAPHAALHLGHGGRPSRHRRRARRHGVGKRLHQGDAGRRAARRDRRASGRSRVRFDGVEPVAGPNWTAIEATLDRAARRRRAVRAHAAGADLQLAADRDQRGGDRDRWDGQLYTVLGKADEQGRWQLRLWWKPFVTLIWLGGALVALGGLLALIGRRPARAPRPSRARRRTA